MAGDSYDQLTMSETVSEIVCIVFCFRSFKIAVSYLWFALYMHVYKIFISKIAKACVESAPE